MWGALFGSNNILAQNYIVRKAVDGSDTECLLAVLISYSTESQLHIFKPIINDGLVVRIKRLTTIHSHQVFIIMP